MSVWMTLPRKKIRYSRLAKRHKEWRNSGQAAGAADIPSLTGFRHEHANNWDTKQNKLSNKREFQKILAPLASAACGKPMVGGCKSQTLQKHFHIFHIEVVCCDYMRGYWAYNHLITRGGAHREGSGEIP